MHRLLLAVTLLWGVAPWAPAEATDGPLVQALVAEPLQAHYLSRHPEILRWIAKHSHEVAGVAGGTADAAHRAKNAGINEWIVAWPRLAEALAADPAQTAAWADDPRALAELAKRSRR